MGVNLTPMRYKDYIWPHNPEVYSVEAQRRLVVHQIPFGRCVVQDLGGMCRILRGEGVFAGEDAYEQFRQLAEVFQEEGSGLLVHPVWRTERAWFASLQVTEEPLPDYVRYRFEFREDWDGYKGGFRELGGTDPAQTESAAEQAEAKQERSVYTVRQGDTLWGIARRYGVTLTALISANPQIKNPNLIYPGDGVVIP